jgi:hypothetical protein
MGTHWSRSQGPLGNPGAPGHSKLCFDWRREWKAMACPGHVALSDRAWREVALVCRGEPVIAITSKDLTAEERLFLNGSALLSHCVRRVLQKGNFTRDDLMREVRELVAAH